MCDSLISLFQNTSLTWGETSWPEFTQCFQDSLLIWLPCGFLWISAPFYLYYLITVKNGRSPRPVTKFSISKIVSIKWNYLHIYLGNVEYSFISITPRSSLPMPSLNFLKSTPPKKKNDKVFNTVYKFKIKW